MARRPWTLRTRLLVSLLAFAAIGLALFGTVTGLLLQQSLMARIDAQLRDNIAKTTTRDRPPPRHGPVINSPALPTNFRIYFFKPDGTPDTTLTPDQQETVAPQLPTMSVASVRQHGSTPYTTDDAGTGSGQWRVAVAVQQPNMWQPAGGTVAVAAMLDDTQSTVVTMAGVELAAGAILLLLLGLTGLIVVRIGLRPLTRIETTAQAIAGGELDLRVADTDPRTETGRLGSSLNVMLARISAALTASAQSEQRLRRFVADASHELRTPLTSIRGFAELYRRGGAPSPADVERLMARIESESIRMGLLVEDLLMLARLDQERSLDFAEVDLLVVAADAVHDARAAAPERRIVLESPHGAVRVIGDEHKLRQVVMNLVTNAVTHTPADAAVRVAVRQERTRPSDHAVAVAGGELPKTSRFAVLEVIDSGPGIPEDQGKLVFDRFYRADQARSRANGGSGLGLAITAAILEAHSGRIELLSIPGQGTKFRVLLAPA
ncbi:sensor histidine kinase [Kutzneria sp. CA-103260]|uniref:sensor histidine kinase n=1 Tax=Kutzneria sp. CA-103260 TaxID=2802641 RepID=UPI001BAD9867|nr:HAMP domain-containing sensor histidine kinase [Kutzneria sp. CA-103260]QUQ67892.1 sensor histidine kinase PhoR [Kutzneria sp. CA-103260]